MKTVADENYSIVSVQSKVLVHTMHILNLVNVIGAARTNFLTHQGVLSMLIGGVPDEAEADSTKAHCM